MNKKAHKKKWTKKRHAIVFALLRVIFRPLTKLRYNFSAEKAKIKGPCIVLCNHTTTLDPFFVSLSFKFPLYFYTSDDLFNIKFISPIIKYLVAPIPKSKSQTDLNSVRASLTVLKEGGAVGLFPEGNRTLSGAQWEMTESVAKLVKLSKVPLVLYNIQGGYGTDPRWGLKIRKGRMRGFIKRIVNPEEYLQMSVDELFEVICSELEVDDTASGTRFKSNSRAENIERVLYICPHCGGISTIYSKNSYFSCKFCSALWEYTEDLHISPKNPFGTVLEWHEWEKTKISELVKTSEDKLFTDGNVKFYESIRMKRKRMLDGKSVYADARAITVEGKKKLTVFPFNEMEGFTILGKRKFNIYFNGKVFQVKGDKKFCPLKYLHLYREVCNV